MGVSFLDVDGVSIAYHHHAGTAPGVVWLGGYRSDMEGTKALELEAAARAAGVQTTRFDYSGHGQSGGDFLDGAISLWTQQARAVIEHITDGPQVLVGSSMGAWVALRLTQILNTSSTDQPVAGLVLLAPAPDFTVELMEPQLTDAQRAQIEELGYFEEPTPYGPEPNRFTRKLFDDGRQNRVMTGPLDTFCPVHIIQGQADPDVPWQHAQRLFELLPKDDATIAYVKDGDHRLSRPDDIAMITRAALAMIERTSAQ